MTDVAGRTALAGPPSPALGALRSPHVRGVLLALMLGLLLAELDQSLFATALPTIAGELAAGDRISWVTTIYILFGTAVMPVLGRIGDDLGRRRVFAVSLGVLVVGSVVGGLAGDLPTLLVARGLQGLGGGGLVVLVQAVIADVLPPRHRAVAFSAVGAVFAAAAVIGPVLGGWLTQTVGWRWAFWLNVPLGLVAVVVALVWLPDPPGPDATGRQRRGLPIASITTLVLAVSGVTLVATWTAPSGRPGLALVVLVACLTAACTVLFVVVDRKASRPLIPVTLLRQRTFAIAVAAGFVFAAALFGAVAYLPTYLQMALGLQPARAGLLMLALVAGLGCATLGAAWIVARSPRYRALPATGAVVAAIALALLATLTPNSSLVLVAATLALLGIGIGCAWDVLVVIAQAAAPRAAVGLATAGNGFFRELGVLVGTAAVGATVASRAASVLSRPDPSGLGDAWTSVTPERLAVLPPDARALVAQAYNGAFTPVFGVLVPVVAVAALLLLLLTRPSTTRTRS